MLRVVHCITDEKFIRSIYQTFEYLQDRCNSRYVHITENVKKQCRYLGDYEKVEFCNISQFQTELASGCCDVVVLHNLQSVPLDFISQIPKDIKLVWFAWGFDIYGCMGSKPLVPIPNLIQPETKRLLWSSFDKQLKEKAKVLYKVTRNRELKKAVARVDYFSGIIPEEYDMMCSVPFFHAKQVDFRYSSPLANISLSMLDDEKPVGGMDIMIGNSGDITNNHADIFNKLKKIELGERRIYVPLSYGEDKKYMSKIKSIGNDLWGDRFVALDDYVPYDEYRRIIGSCGFRIFGHERQQALGNIIMAFRDGCKVFLSDGSALYRHFVNMGVKVFTIQNDINPDCLSDLLNDKETYENRKKTIEYSQTSAQKERLYKLIDYLTKEVENAK